MQCTAAGAPAAAGEAAISRTFAILGVILAVLAVAWWAVYFGSIASATGASATDVYGETINCLFYTSDVCAVLAQVTTITGFEWPAYQPVILWIAAIAIFLAILLPRRRRS